MVLRRYHHVLTGIEWLRAETLIGHSWKEGVVCLASRESRA